MMKLRKIENQSISLSKSWKEAFIYGVNFELEFTPKPGLVDLNNNGSHPNLDMSIMKKSVSMIDDYLEEVRSLCLISPDVTLFNEIRKRTEDRMMKAFNVIPHQGYLFLSGLMMLSLSQNNWSIDHISKVISATAKELFEKESYLSKKKIGLKEEGLKGLPILLEILPKKLSALSYYNDYLVLTSLMSVVQDSNCYRRAGDKGVTFLNEMGEKATFDILNGACPTDTLKKIDEQFIIKEITMGEVGDYFALYQSLWKFRSRNKKGLKN